MFKIEIKMRGREQPSLAVQEAQADVLMALEELKASVVRAVDSSSYREFCHMAQNHTENKPAPFSPLAAAFESCDTSLSSYLVSTAPNICVKLTLYLPFHQLQSMKKSSSSTTR